MTTARLVGARRIAAPKIVANLISAMSGRWAYNFDCIDDLATFYFRAINPDGPIDIEWVHIGYDPTQVNSQTIISQSIATPGTSREFYIRVDANEALVLHVKGVSNATAANVYRDGRWEVVVTGTTWQVYRDGLLVHDGAFSKGTASEPTATTVVGARYDTSAYTNFTKGVIADVKINGIAYLIDNPLQRIQLPTPTGLGPELITPEVLVNPVVKGTQWTYLGEGRWQFVGDGSLNSLEFISGAAGPEQGYLEFEIESISGQITCSNDGANNSVFSTTGPKRYIYTEKATQGNPLGYYITFKRFPAGSVASCIIKNISFHALASCNPLFLRNINTERWQSIALKTIMLKYGYDFDGVDDHCVLQRKAIDIDSNSIKLEFYLPNNVAAGGINRTIISQTADTGNNSNSEFLVFISAVSGNLGVTIGGATFAAADTGQFLAGHRCRLTFTGTQCKFENLNTEFTLTRNFTKGAVREPNVSTVIGARGNVGGFSQYFTGLQRNFVINDVVYDIGEKGLAVQIPTPYNVGAELITQAVIDNPNVKGSQWTYLGDNTWSYVGDGNYNQLSLIAPAALPTAAVLEFEIVDIVGQMACTITPQVGPDLTINSSSSFGVANKGSKFRFYYLQKGNSNNASAGNVIEFKRGIAGQVASCVIKNISLKPLGTVNMLNLRNANSERWKDIVE